MPRLVTRSTADQATLYHLAVETNRTKDIAYDMTNHWKEDRSQSPKPAVSVPGAREGQEKPQKVSNPVGGKLPLPKVEVAELEGAFGKDA